MTLIKSVSGVRGIARSAVPEDVTMTAEVARRLARAYVTYLQRRGSGAAGLTIVVGRDGRAGGDLLLSAFLEGARDSGARGMDLGIVTTPGVGLMVRALGASGGAVITASHNPGQWNGVKLLTPEGCAPTADEATAIFDVFDREAFLTSSSTPSSATVTIGPHEYHVTAVLRTVDVERIRSRAFSVVLDSINGAGAAAGRMLLDRLGCRLTHMNDAPADAFAHAPEPIEANLVALCKRVRSVGADVGFAQDPDADRLAIVDETGRYIGEEYTLALCARRVWATRPGPAAANLSTSRLIDDVAAAAGAECRVHRSAVGEANVVAAMKAHACVIGGEGNGGVIDPRVVYVRDSLVAMALVLDLLAAEETTLSSVVGQLPEYAMIKDKVVCDASRVAEALAAVRRAFADGNMRDVDGVRVDWARQRKWLHVRGSNTEPIVRIIAEALDRSAAQELVDRAREVATGSFSG